MEIRTYETIEAPAARVWEVLADFPGHDRWDPMISGLRGRCEPGARVFFWIKLGPARLPITAEVLHATPGEELRWVGPSPRWARGLASGEHYFTLTALGPDRCRIDHGETFRGAVVPVRSDRVEQVLRPAYEAFNRALKREVEGAARAAQAS